MLAVGMPARDTTEEPLVALPCVPWQVAHVAETPATYNSSLLCAEAAAPANVAKEATKSVANRTLARLFIMLVSPSVLYTKKRI
jgi:hypothetical protein